ncbi:hypothetical protein PAXINDRAFT_16974 [Paxillus involutus ATCC 200175]|uniref:Uncharacterized protein n=1 Tax=Paxillus involutus ATCC 200175 TaxID=664439 RepID=A0A0C9TRZ0_PAXIN|nr:hypothetical protein PAXINDRAFT_16974 [Paxillus involutus ATCC 200175]
MLDHSQASDTTTSAGTLNSGATVTYSLHIREALYQSSTSPDCPLSYQEMIQRWWLALAKKEAAKCRLEEAQQEFEDYESDIIEVIGPATYNHFLNMYVAALACNSSGQSAYFDEFMLLTPMPDLTQCM